MIKTRSYKSDLIKALTDPIEAQEYLNAALEDDDPEVFLLALKDVVEANNIMCGSAQAIESDRDLDKTLFAKGNSQLNSIRIVLSNMGFKLAIEQDAAS